MGSVQTIDGGGKQINATANDENKSKKSENNSKGSKSNSKMDGGMPIQSVQQLQADKDMIKQSAVNRSLHDS